MALTVPPVLHSLYGKLFGLDRFGHAISRGWREPYETSTAASTLANVGTSVISGTTAVWTLAAPPAVGVQKEIINASSISTATLSVVRSTVDGACSFLSLSSGHGSTMAGDSADVKRLNLLNVGSAVRLRAISTAQWAIVTHGTTLFLSISTSS